MTGVELEPAILCLIASLFWAPVVYIAATRLDRDRALSTSELLWIVALAVAALPTLIAPAFAAAGISLRPDAAILPMVAAPEVIAIPDETAAIVHPVTPPITFATIFDAAALLYIYGVLLAFGVWLTRCIIFAAHVRRAKSIDHPQLIFALQMWRRRLGVSSRLRVKVSDAVSSVCVYGLFRPVIIVPSDLNARISFDDLVMMCAHELAHVKRGDCRLFASAAAARILFWFNPFLKRIAARAELAAEQSADALVLEAGADRRAYAACFVEGLRFAAERAQLARVAVPSFTPFDKKSRRDRLDAILSGQIEPRRAPSRLAVGIAASLAAALAFAQAAFAVYPDPQAPSADAKLPVAGDVTLPFGATFKDDNGNEQAAHKGIDIKAPKGAPVVAYDDGIIIDATDLYQNKPSYGKVVAVKHRNGVVTLYAHLDSYSVAKGDRVTAGEKLGEVGATGKVTGPHLHFETLVDGKAVDPQTITLAGARSNSTTMWAAAPAAPMAAPIAPEPSVSPEPAVTPTPKPAVAPTPEPVVAVTVEPVIVGSAPKASHVIVKPGAAPGEFHAFAVAPNAITRIYSKDGKQQVISSDFKWSFTDDGDFNFEFDNSVSAEDRKKIEKSMKTMRKQLEHAKLEHAKAMEQMRTQFGALDFANAPFVMTAPIDGAELDKALEKARVNRDGIFKALDEALDGAKVDWQENVWARLQEERDRMQAERHKMQAARGRAQAAWDLEQEKRDQRQALLDAAQAQRDIEQAMRDEEQRQRDEERAEHERERAERQAELAEARLIAQEERRQALEEARIEREEALEEARIEREEALRDARESEDESEEELRMRSEALAEAERALQEERAEIERLRAELNRKKAERKTDGN